MFRRVSEWLTEQARAELAAVPGPPTREVLAPALTVEDVIAQAIAAREGEFSMADAQRLPPVIRARMLLTSMAAQLPAVLYRDGQPAPEQPRIVKRPTAYLTRGEFVAQSVGALVDVGECFWRLGDYDSDNRPQFASVLANDEVDVSWAPGLRGLMPRYRWRGLDLVADRDIKHVAINRRAGELHGRGPISEGLPYLAGIDAAELYAAGWFGSGGVPSVTLRTKAEVDAQQSADMKAKWMASHAAGVPTPAVLGGGVEDHYPDVNPQTSQLQEARSNGRTIVAVLLGIPGPLLQVESHGSTITYQNALAALGELVKGTLAPSYLSPIELAWSDLVGSRATVRFDLGETGRADVEARYRVYTQMTALGVADADEIRAWEGLGPRDAVTQQPALSPSPQPRPVSLQSLGMVTA